MRYSVDVDVMMPMSDGTRLATDLWRPEVNERIPVLLVRTPYGKHELTSAYSLSNPNIFALMEAGYAVAIQECRGTFRSEGDVFMPHIHDAADGADTIRWLAKQQWCSGKVGMWGVSYLGFDQWQAAATAVPELKAIVPSFGPSDLYRGVWYSQGGGLSLAVILMWTAGNAATQALRRLPKGTANPADLQALGALFQRYQRPTEELMRTTPVAHQPLIAKYLPLIDQILAHPTRDAFWTSLSAIEKLEQITTPALTITGWYDQFLADNLATYVAARKHAGSEEARNGQRLIIGTWPHSPRGFDGVHPDRDFGPTAHVASAQLTETHIAFFDRWLKGRENALDGQAPVRVFVMGIDQWRDEQAWPLPDTRYVDHYLDGAGTANTADGDGVLAISAAKGDATDSYLYDPRRPVPLYCGLNPALDQQQVETRQDVLCFTTPLLHHAVEVTGPVSLTVFVSSSAVDTDFTAKLVDVFPDGRAMWLCEGMQRMRYRETLARSTLMIPGEVYEIQIELAATSNVFLPGHRIRLEVSSSAFPRYDRNSNTGGSISGEREDDMVIALNRIYHGPTHPSRLVLPIIER